uniref:V-type proton ATPase subunit a n=1 Tax=Ditylenchus dipsaci TaxID=166011 RepID=A0A915DZG4_9BILA
MQNAQIDFAVLTQQLEMNPVDLMEFIRNAVNAVHPQNVEVMNEQNQDQPEIEQELGADNISIVQSEKGKDKAVHRGFQFRQTFRNSDAIVEVERKEEWFMQSCLHTVQGNSSASLFHTKKSHTIKSYGSLSVKHQRPQWTTRKVSMWCIESQCQEVLFPWVAIPLRGDALLPDDCGKDAAFACVAEIGKKPFVEFKDLNSEVNSFQRMFVRDIRRFDEMERKLRFMENQIRKDEIEIVDNTWKEEVNVMSHHEINQLEQTLTDLEIDEWESVLEKTDGFFEGGINDVAMQEIEQAQETDAGFALKEKEPIGYIVGVISHEKVNAFERILWRACRRTAFVRYCEIEEELENPDTGEKMHESVFIVFYNGDRLRSIIDKVSEGFKAKQFNQCPKTSSERHAAALQVRSNITDMRTVMAQTKEHRLKVLNAAAVNLRSWLKQVRLHKSIYHTLNLFTFDGIGKFFVAECWIPLRDIENVRVALETGVGKNGGTVKPVLNVLHTDEPPPTYNRTNKFTAVFQSIVDSYGIASYLEVNPAPYTIITFPFIFSCMFGDLGHGMLMFLAGLYLVMREKNLEARQIRDESRQIKNRENS